MDWLSLFDKLDIDYDYFFQNNLLYIIYRLKKQRKILISIN
jgi:hypothetical protein